MEFIPYAREKLNSIYRSECNPWPVRPRSQLSTNRCVLLAVKLQQFHNDRSLWWTRSRHGSGGGGGGRRSRRSVKSSDWIVMHYVDDDHHLLITYTLQIAYNCTICITFQHAAAAIASDRHSILASIDRRARHLKGLHRTGVATAMWLNDYNYVFY